MTKEMCPHGVRYPHPCRECEDAVPVAEVKLFAELMEMRKERDVALADATRWKEELDNLIASCAIALESPDDDIAKWARVVVADLRNALADVTQWKERAEKAEKTLSVIEQDNNCGLAPDGEGCNTMAELRFANEDSDVLAKLLGQFLSDMESPNMQAYSGYSPGNLGQVRAALAAHAVRRGK